MFQKGKTTNKLTALLLALVMLLPLLPSFSLTAYAAPTCPNPGCRSTNVEPFGNFENEWECQDCGYIFGGPSGGDEDDVSFTKVTDASQITAENIGTCTAEEAKAWILANWDDVNEDFVTDIAFYSNTGELYFVQLYSGLHEEDLSTYFDILVDTASISNLQEWFADGHPVFICTPAAPAEDGPLVGTVIKVGDTLTLDGDYIEVMPGLIDQATDSFKLVKMEYDDYFNGWGAVFEGTGAFLIAGDETPEPDGFYVSGGNGTQSHPYTLALHYASAAPVTEWHIGDPINLGGKYYINDDQGAPSSYGFDRDVIVSEPVYETMYNQWIFENVIASNASEAYALYISLPTGKTASDVPTGFKVKSGDGTQGSPYTFELVYAEAVTFGKVTSADDIKAENIGACTFDDAKAWVLDNWDAIIADAGDAFLVEFAYTVNGNLSTIGFEPNITKDDFQDNITEVSCDINTLLLDYTLGGFPIYLCGFEAAAAAVTEWESGDCIVTYDSTTTTMTVTKKDGDGNGKMADYTADNDGNPAPWESVIESVTTIVISDGVTGVGDWAFYDDKALNNVTFPASVTSIGTFAFYHASQQISASFVRPASESTLTVGNGAFNYYTLLSYSGDSKYTLFEGDSEIELTGAYDFKGDKLNGKSLTWKLPTYSITDKSENGTVTASVGGNNVTEAVIGDTVLLTVAPASGYQFKSITATSPKDSPEEFSDLVDLMGTAVFDGTQDDWVSFSGYTCKVVNDGFEVSYGTTKITEAASSDVTGFSIASPTLYCFSCGDIGWNFVVNEGKITFISIYDNSNWSELFEGEGTSNGALVPAEIELTTVTEGSQYSFTMPKKPVTVTAEFEAATAYADYVNTTTVIKFDDKDWYLIEDNSTAVDAGTVTLLAKECVGASKFGDNNTYSGSTLESYVNSYYADNFSAAAQAAVSEGLFILTREQAQTIHDTNVDVLKCSQADGADYNKWWLSSSGSNKFYAAYVYGDSGDVSNSGSLLTMYGVRPALQLDLSKVEFDSETKTFALPAAVTEYPLYVGDTQVTSENLSGTGWSFAPADGTTPATLTLSGITVSTYSGEGNHTYGIFWGDTAALNIVLTADTVNTVSPTGAVYGIFSKGAVTISGTGTLTAAGKKSSGATGIVAKGLTISGGNVNINGAYGIYCQGYTVTISGGALTATGDFGAVKGTVKNAIAGTGWTNKAGTEGQAAIAASTTGQNLSTYKKVYFTPHTHDFNYSVNGATITATCTDGCPAGYDNANKPTLTIVAPTLTTYGQTGEGISSAAALDGLDAFNAATGLNVDADSIVYWKAKIIEGVYKTDGNEPLAGAPTNAGNYLAKITVSNCIASVGYTIAKADPSYTVPTGLTAVFGNLLSSVFLPDGWSWANGSQTVGNVGTNTFKATFTPTDTTNYNTVENVDVTVTVSKADPSYTVPTGLTATYGQTLANVTLPTGWTWANGDQVVGNVGTNTFKATFTPTDTTNYNTVENVDVTVTVGKADPSYTVPTGLTATYCDTLSSVTLPTGWTWADDAATSVGNAGANTFKATFTPADTTNYNTVENVDVTVTVSKADPDYTVPTDLTAAYGQTLADVTLPDGWAWADDAATSVGNAGANTFKANFTPDDTANYNTISDVDVKVTVNKADSAPATVAANEITCDGTEKALVTVTGEAVGGEMQYALGKDATTAPEDGWSTDIPAATNTGTYFVWYKVVADENHNDSTPVCVEVTIDPNYTVKEVTGLSGNGKDEWTKGGEDGVVITVKDSGEDNSFDHFTGVKLDGQLLTKDVDYTVTKSSTIVTLLPATLEKLSVGEHTVTVLFDNGEVNTDLTIKAANSGSATSPQTGDNSHMGLWIAIMILSLCALAATLFIGKKKRVFDR